MEFRQGTIEEILDSETKMVLTASQRYGKYYDTAAECTFLIMDFMKAVDRSRWVFASFVPQVQKHQLLALFSAVQLHKVQSMMNLRRVLEAGACAAFAIANPDHEHFVDTDPYGILDPSQKLARKRYDWLTENFPEGSKAIEEKKRLINDQDAHANLVSTYRNYRYNDNASAASSFFDITDDHHVKLDLWRIGDVALTLLHLFCAINENRNVIEFADNFWPLIQKLGQKNETLQAELMSSDRVKQAMAMAPAISAS
jgi:hypothetical protein